LLSRISEAQKPKYYIFTHEESRPKMIIMGHKNKRGLLKWETHREGTRDEEN
jgi:hypothetical protein